MIEGQITITDEKGGTILSANIWAIILTNICYGRMTVNLKKVRVYIDGDEIPIPETFKDVV